MKWIVLAVMVAMLGGCTLTREVPPAQSFRLDDGGTVASVPAKCDGRVIRVALLQAPQRLEGTSIYYAAQDHKMYSYTLARWEQPPVEQLQQIIEKSVIESALFRGVIPYRSLAKNDWLLEVRIERMMQTIGAGGRGETELMLYGVLIDQGSRRVLAQKTFRYRHESVHAGVQSAVNAWNESVATFKTELVTWLAQQCSAFPKKSENDEAF